MSVLVVPLLARGRRLGVLTVRNKRVGSSVEGLLDPDDQDDVRYVTGGVLIFRWHTDVLDVLTLCICMCLLYTGLLGTRASIAQRASGRRRWPSCSAHLT
jgi:hypothetical protein